MWGFYSGTSSHCFLKNNDIFLNLVNIINKSHDFFAHLKMERKEILVKKYMFHKFFAGLQSISFQVTYWDGSIEQYGPEDPKFELVFHGNIPFSRFIMHPALAFGEAYMNGSIDIIGPLEEVIKAAYKHRKVFWRKPWSQLPKISTVRKQKENVQHHYDLGNEFYSLWLDNTMSYSCAYFMNAEDSLEQAQLQKIDHTLRKLQLKQGESLLDIGSGWGWLIIRAAQQYGVNSTGITLSEEQFRMTRQRISEMGLDNQVTVELIDYRELAATRSKV